MKLLLLTDNYWPRIGGAETYAWELALGMAARGHDVTVYTDGDRHAPALRTSMEHGVRVIRDSSFWPRLEGEGGAWENLVFGRLPELSEILREGCFDIIHANNHDTALLGALVRLDQNLPLVVTSHEVGRQDGPLGDARLRFVMQVLPVDLVLCMSDFYAQEARRYGAPKVERVYLGVDTAKFHPVRVAEDSDNVRVVCLARFKPRKGLDVLVRAAAIVLRENPRVDFTIAGSTSSASTNYAQELREMIDRLEVCDSVRIREDVTLDMVPDLLRSSHIAVQPSFGEGLGLAALEALSTGLPIVASRTTGLTEFIRDAENGLLVAPGDVAGLAAAITRLVTDQNLRAQLGAEGRRTVTEGFDSETMLKQTEALYEGLVRDRLPARQAPTP